MSCSETEYFVSEFSMRYRALYFETVHGDLIQIIYRFGSLPGFDCFFDFAKKIDMQEFITFLSIEYVAVKGIVPSYSKYHGKKSRYH